MRKRCLPQTGRSCQQDMIQRLIALSRGRNEDTQVFDDFMLTVKIVETQGSQSLV